jgi:biopolymer transport protein ExbB
MTMLRKFTALLLCLMAFAGPAWAEGGGGWWNKDWEYRKAIAIDASPSGLNMSGPVGRATVLVKLTSGNFTFTDTLENGADLRFVDSDDKTPLAFHIERFDAKTGIAYVWVDIPLMNGGEKKQIWLYFANPNAPVGGDAKATFDPDYLAVYHFGQNVGQPSADTTANGNNAQSAPPGIDEGSVIGRAARFPGQGAITVPASPSLALPAATPFTLSMWVKPEQLGADQAIVARGPLVFGLKNGMPYVAVGAASVEATAAVKQGEWTHLAMIADGSVVKLYVNGIEAAAASAALPALDGPLTIGGTQDRPFTGAIDELRLSKSARSANLILAMANAEGPANKLVVVSETAEKPGGGSGVIGFIVSKLEPVDSVIIALCMMLLAAAIALMVAKIRYLNKCQRGNVIFLKRFAAMHEELVPIMDIPGITLPEVTFIRSSPLGRLYNEGLNELEIRRRRGRASLSGEAVEAMRAAVDAIVVDENQKLDKWMVILTIAISGGPFIGLLGTVVGVMTVFGGVAMAGDVNVNAIAPGIAAALLATIAGLACAIPSLFGYNYLNSRISALADQMRVFVDRLITRLAETAADEAPPPQPRLMAAE